MSEIEHQQSAPSAGEAVHMPAPSVLPLINAAALAFAIVCITVSWVLVGVGLLVFLVTTIRWIADTRHAIAELPLEHDHH
jgi:hypothetical protein